jgi:hypothetical protein
LQRIGAHTIRRAGDIQPTKFQVLRDRTAGPDGPLALSEDHVFESAGASERAATENLVLKISMSDSGATAMTVAMSITVAAAVAATALPAMARPVIHMEGARMAAGMPAGGMLCEGHSDLRGAGKDHSRRNRHC